MIKYALRVAIEALRSVGGRALLHATRRMIPSSALKQVFESEHHANQWVRDQFTGVFRG